MLSWRKLPLRKKRGDNKTTVDCRWMPTCWLRMRIKRQSNNSALAMTRKRRSAGAWTRWPTRSWLTRNPLMWLRLPWRWTVTVPCRSQSRTWARWTTRSTEAGKLSVLSEAEPGHEATMIAVCRMTPETTKTGRHPSRSSLGILRSTLIKSTRRKKLIDSLPRVGTFPSRWTQKKSVNGKQAP